MYYNYKNLILHLEKLSNFVSKKKKKWIEQEANNGRRWLQYITCSEPEQGRDERGKRLKPRDFGGSPHCGVLDRRNEHLKSLTYT